MRTRRVERPSVGVIIIIIDGHVISRRWSSYALRHKQRELGLGVVVEQRVEDLRWQGQQRERRTTGEVLHELAAIEASVRLESVLVRVHALQAARCMRVPLLKVENYICH